MQIFHFLFPLPPFRFKAAKRLFFDCKRKLEKFEFKRIKCCLYKLYRVMIKQIREGEIRIKVLKFKGTVRRRNKNQSLKFKGTVRRRNKNQSLKSKGTVRRRKKD